MIIKHFDDSDLTHPILNGDEWEDYKFKITYDFSKFKEVAIHEQNPDKYPVRVLTDKHYFYDSERDRRYIDHQFFYQEGDDWVCRDI